VGGLDDSRSARRSGGNSRSLKACREWLDVKGISLSYCVAMLFPKRQIPLNKFLCALDF